MMAPPPLIPIVPMNTSPVTAALAAAALKGLLNISLAPYSLSMQGGCLCVHVCVWLCVCVVVCVWLCVCVVMCVCVCCVYVCMCVCMFVHMHVHMYVCVYVYVCVCGITAIIAVIHYDRRHDLVGPMLTLT